MRQFVRIFRDAGSGSITHLHTQTSPIEHDAVSVEGVEFMREDCVVEDAETASNDERGRFKPARELMDAMEIDDAGRPKVIDGAMPSITMRAITDASG